MATDDFNRADEVLSVNANWTNNSGQIAINSNAIYPNSSFTDSMVHWSAGSFSDDQYSEGTITAITSGNYIGVAVRCADAADTGYRFVGDSTDSELGWLNAGSYTAISTGGNAFSPGDVVKIEVSGSSPNIAITCYINGSTAGAPAAVTGRTEIDSGRPGVASYGDSINTKMDDWIGADISSASSIPVFMNHYRQMRS